MSGISKAAAACMPFGASFRFITAMSSRRCGDAKSAYFFQQSLVQRHGLLFHAERAIHSCAHAYHRYLFAMSLSSPRCSPHEQFHFTFDRSRSSRRGDCLCNNARMPLSGEDSSTTKLLLKIRASVQMLTRLFAS
jgi:hypothetical protein